ncbi:hypothetical protein PROFUN_09514 [Planoprotostelium fungivorum]|uniref:Uncharacterized protein n=1 Tax=Planoprotostelium fungivorum TaxID=1890364 RepID=A0A2P6NH94_9EUKA|nr:hypothetical protein PROFUN_12145 [Planoprotostelium fungivorum]PRP83302.1 hypothetical protein PROFUN_09514 [Planoprotostelium fungivorum]
MNDLSTHNTQKQKAHPRVTEDLIAATFAAAKTLFASLPTTFVEDNEEDAEKSDTDNWYLLEASPSKKRPGGDAEALSFTNDAKLLGKIRTAHTQLYKEVQKLVDRTLVQMQEAGKTETDRRQQIVRDRKRQSIIQEKLIKTRNNVVDLCADIKFRTKKRDVEGLIRRSIFEAIVEANKAGGFIDAQLQVLRHNYDVEENECMDSLEFEAFLRKFQSDTGHQIRCKNIHNLSEDYIKLTDKYGSIIQHKMASQLGEDCKVSIKRIVSLYYSTEDRKDLDSISLSSITSSPTTSKHALPRIGKFYKSNQTVELFNSLLAEITKGKDQKGTVDTKNLEKTRKFPANLPRLPLFDAEISIHTRVIQWMRPSFVTTISEEIYFCVEEWILYRKKNQHLIEPHLMPYEKNAETFAENQITFTSEAFDGWTITTKPSHVKERTRGTILQLSLKGYVLHFAEATLQHLLCSRFGTTTQIVEKDRKMLEEKYPDAPAFGITSPRTTGCERLYIICKDRKLRDAQVLKDEYLDALTEDETSELFAGYVLRNIQYTASAHAIFPDFRVPKLTNSPYWYCFGYAPTTSTLRNSKPSCIVQFTTTKTNQESRMDLQCSWPGCMCPCLDGSPLCRNHVFLQNWLVNRASKDRNKREQEKKKKSIPNVVAQMMAYGNTKQWNITTATDEMQEMNWNIESNPIVSKLLNGEYQDQLAVYFERIKLAKKGTSSAVSKVDK